MVCLAAGHFNLSTNSHLVGMNEYDKIEAHRRAKQNASELYDQHYSNADQYDPNQYDRPQRLQDYQGQDQGY